MARQNQIAVRCIAMESVVRNLSAFLVKAMPPGVATSFLDSLAALGAAPIDAAMPPEQAEQLRALVAKEQRHIVDLIREQKGPTETPRPGAGQAAEA